MIKWHIENSETSEISKILFRVFLFPNFRFCPTAKIENLDLKISEKNFRGFRVFDLARQILDYVSFQRDINRSNFPHMFYKIGILKNFAKFTWKHLWRSLFLQAWVTGCNWDLQQAEACIFIKKEIPAHMFSCDFCEIFKSNFFYRNFRWLLLCVSFQTDISIWFKIKSRRIKGTVPIRNSSSFNRT